MLRRDISVVGESKYPRRCPGHASTQGKWMCSLSSHACDNIQVWLLPIVTMLFHTVRECSEFLVKSLTKSDRTRLLSLSSRAS